MNRSFLSRGLRLHLSSQRQQSRLDISQSHPTLTTPAHHRRRTTAKRTDGDPLGNLSKLPPELRQFVYSELLTFGEPLRIFGNSYSVDKTRLWSNCVCPLSIGILRASSAIHAEAIPVPYGENTFHMFLDRLIPFMEKIGAKSVHCLKKITIPFANYKISEEDFGILRQANGIKCLTITTIKMDDDLLSGVLAKVLKSFFRASQEKGEGTREENTVSAIGILHLQEDDEYTTERMDTQWVEFERGIKARLLEALHGELSVEAVQKRTANMR